MKKYLIVLLAAGMLTGIAACGTDKKPDTDSANGQVTTESSVDENSEDESAATISEVETFTITVGEGEAGAIAP